MKKQKGFTFIELLAVIVILGLLITLATIAISSLKKKQDEKNYLNEISSIFTGAKNYIADHPERLSFGVRGDNPYKCSGIYSVYEKTGPNSARIVKEDGVNPLYLYLNEKIYKLEGNQFKEITERDGNAVSTWDSIGNYYEEGIVNTNPYKYFLGWYDFSESPHTSWNRSWIAEGIESEDPDFNDNIALFKEVLEDNDRKVLCTTSEGDISMSTRSLESLGYISIEKNSQIYNVLYNTFKYYSKDERRDRVKTYLESGKVIPGEGGPLMDSYRIGLYRCVNLNTNASEFSGFENLNLVYEFYKYKLDKNVGSDELYKEYIPNLEAIYNDCGCEMQQDGNSSKLCSARNYSNWYCTYWTGGYINNNYMLEPSFGCKNED